MGEKSYQTMYYWDTALVKFNLIADQHFTVCCSCYGKQNKHSLQL